MAKKYLVQTYDETSHKKLNLNVYEESTLLMTMRVSPFYYKVIECVDEGTDFKTNLEIYEN